MARIWGEYFSTSETDNEKNKTPAKPKKVNDQKRMAYYQSPRKWAGSTSSRNEVSWIARATGITSEGNNPHYYYGMSINGVLDWATDIAIPAKQENPRKKKNTFWYSESTINFTYQGIHYEALDFLYISPSHFEESQNGNQSVIEDDEDLMPKSM
nr:DNA (cytosine-5)-methyltransferase 1-like [Ipomoea batatas]GMC73984.1 DNA (cytosine-5)-methyltransferase 1-like [Ipomoea batatas]